MKNIDDYSRIVRLAYESGISNIGQLSDEEARLLNAAVKDGILMKVRDFRYPIPKTRYVVGWNHIAEGIDK